MSKDNTRKSSSHDAMKIVDNKHQQQSNHADLEPYDAKVLQTILDRLKRDRIEFDADLYTGQREPWYYVDVETHMSDRNIHWFILRRFLNVCMKGVKIYLVCVLVWVSE